MTGDDRWPAAVSALPLQDQPQGECECLQTEGIGAGPRPLEPSTSSIWISFSSEVFPDSHMRLVPNCVGGGVLIFPAWLQVLSDAICVGIPVKKITQEEMYSDHDVCSYGIPCCWLNLILWNPFHCQMIGLITPGWEPRRSRLGRRLQPWPHRSSPSTTYLAIWASVPVRLSKSNSLMGESKKQDGPQCGCVESKDRLRGLPSNIVRYIIVFDINCIVPSINTWN